MSTPMQCEICNKSFKGSIGLGIHVKTTHKSSSQKYYDTYLKAEPEGKCLTCGSTTRFNSISAGYVKFCSAYCSCTHSDTIKLRKVAAAEAHEKNPLIKKEAAIKAAKTMKDTGIRAQAVKKRLATYIKDPSIMDKAKAKWSISLREHYNKKKQASDCISCDVYIVAHSSLDIVKIGITTNLNTRMASIRKDFGPVEIVSVIETTYNLALAIETKLHSCFKGHCKVQPHGGGRTEWFDSVILDRATDMLEQSTSQELPDK